MTQVGELVKEGSDTHKSQSSHKIKKALEEALLQVNETITSVFQQTNETLNRDLNFFKFSLLDIVLASTSVVLAFIAIVNSACLCNLASFKKNKRSNSGSINDLELTPIVKKGIKFGKDKVKEYNDYSSIDTLPSPEPTVRKSFHK